MSYISSSSPNQQLTYRGERGLPISISAQYHTSGRQEWEGLDKEQNINHLLTTACRYLNMYIIVQAKRKRSAYECWKIKSTFT